MEKMVRPLILVNTGADIIISVALNGWLVCHRLVLDADEM